MKRKELINLKKRLQEEIGKRDRLKELLNEDIIQDSDKENVEKLSLFYERIY